MFLSFRLLLLSYALTRVKVSGIQVTEEHLMSAFKCAATLRCTALFVFGMAHSFNAAAADLLQYRAFATQQQASAGLYGR